VLSLPFRMASCADAIGPRGTLDRAARTVTIRAAEACWPALIGALFVSWAMSPSANQRRDLTGSPLGCVFRGKAGVICSGSASAAQQVRTESDSCINFGRGGHYCPPTN
jgi:hypothetical protein